MNNDFDNEIDGLLRASVQASLADSREPDVMHLDADEISAFAENALPAVAQSRCTEHLADCDPCRKNLSAIISLNAQNPAQEPVRREIVAPVPALSWYQKLFSFPNLAYGMGALVLVFTGITAFTLLQSNRSGTDLAMADTASKKISPALDNRASEPPIPESLEDASTAANTAASPSDSIPDGRATDPAGREQSGPVFGKLKDADRDTVINSPGAVQREDDKSVSDRANELSADVRSAPPPPSEPMASGQSPANPKKSTIITERSESVDEETVGQAERRKESYREVSGKTFNRKADGIWYDSAYKNQRTTNITRGSNDYRNLDRGLRVIAEEFTETVVVVWGTRAFRIK